MEHSEVLTLYTIGFFNALFLKQSLSKSIWLQNLCQDW